MKTLKGALIILAIVLMCFVIWTAVDFFFFYDSDTTTAKEENSSGITAPKPAPELAFREVDSIRRTAAHDTLVVTGSGETGYSFLIFFNATERGKLFIRVFDLNENKELSANRFGETNGVSTGEPDSCMKLFTLKSNIREGVPGKYFPARFELWFKPFQSGKAVKVNEVEYLVDGMGR
ncbi:hypothetical protein SDC9_65220 [bioreactor metagenome]|uniref:Uncharacterized protein n=1 Tax=bioreactor metagenome TaxID=1076179 RepID=A0A644XXM6_9ZZZZ